MALYKALDGDGPMSHEWLIGRICDEFHCKPSEAVNEPLGLCLRIIEERSFASAKDTVERTKKMEDLPKSPMIDLVQEIQFEIAKEQLGSRKDKQPRK